MLKQLQLRTFFTEKNVTGLIRPHIPNNCYPRRSFFFCTMPHDTDAHLGTSAGSSAPAVGVKVPRERKFGKYSGTRDDRILENWIADAERAVRELTDRKALDSMLSHLEVVAKKQVRLRPLVSSSPTPWPLGSFLPDDKKRESQCRTLPMP